MYGIEFESDFNSGYGVVIFETGRIFGGRSPSHTEFVMHGVVVERPGADHHHETYPTGGTALKQEIRSPQKRPFSVERPTSIRNVAPPELLTWLSLPSSGHKGPSKSGQAIIAYTVSCPLPPDLCILLSLPAANPWASVLS
jgi:hypothetical protein